MLKCFGDSHEGLKVVVGARHVQGDLLVCYYLAKSGGQRVGFEVFIGNDPVFVYELLQSLILSLEVHTQHRQATGLTS